jgi:hypothetical protein
MGEMMTENKSRQKTKPSVLVKWGKKVSLSGLPKANLLMRYARVE